MNISMSDRYVAKKIDLDNIDSSFMDLYIEPTEGWNEFRPQALATLNFTWNVREFNDKVMRIKLNFTNAPAISPYLRYDKLVVKIKDIYSLFIEKDTGERRLQT